MRIMGLDYGSRTVGVAVSDALGLTAQGVETVTREEENKLGRPCAGLRSWQRNMRWTGSFWAARKI